MQENGTATAHLASPEQTNPMCLRHFQVVFAVHKECFQKHTVPLLVSKLETTKHSKASNSFRPSQMLNIFANKKKREKPILRSYLLPDVAELFCRPSSTSAFLLLSPRSTPRTVLLEMSARSVFPMISRSVLKVCWLSKHIRVTNEN